MAEDLSPNGLALDLHNYQLYTPAQNARTQPMHIVAACNWSVKLTTARTAMPVYVGEWSALTHICVDGSCATDDTTDWSPGLVKQIRRYVEAQMETFERFGDGWFLWSFGGPGGWGIDNLIEVGAVPNPVGDREYSGECV